MKGGLTSADGGGFNLTGGDVGTAVSWMLPLAIGAMGAIRPQTTQPLTAMASLIAQQQGHQLQKEQIAALEKERTLDREFRARQEELTGRREAREVAKEEAGITAGRMFPEITAGITETVPGQPAALAHPPIVGEDVEAQAYIQRIEGVPPVSR